MREDKDSFLDGRAMGKGESGQSKGCVRVGLRGSRDCGIEEERRLGKDVCVCVCVCVCAHVTQQLRKMLPILSGHVTML